MNVLYFLKYINDNLSLALRNCRIVATVPPKWVWMETKLLHKPPIFGNIIFMKVKLILKFHFVTNIL